MVSCLLKLKIYSLMLCLALVLLCVSGTGVGTAYAESSESELEAVFLYNFISYVSWANKGDEPMICVYGNDQIADLLGRIKEKKARYRSFNVKIISYGERLERCHIVFLSQNRARDLKRLLQYADQDNVLTVSDIPRFAYKGGMIGFIKARGKIKLEINNKAALAENIKISSNLLKIADVVE